MFTRRELLRILGAGAFSLSARSSFGSFFSRPRKKSPPRVVPNRFTKDGKALIGVSSGKSPLEMIKEAVSLIGGFEKLSLKGKTVLVKPNVVSGEGNPATTNPAVVSAAARVFYENGAKKVYVGDMSAMATLSTLRNMKKNGIYKSAVDAGAEVVVFEDYGWVEVDVPAARYIKSAHTTQWLYDVDIVANLPVIKTHRSASYSIALKNFIGCTHLRQRPYLIDETHWEELVAEFNLAYSPDITIVDGTVSMIEGGPWSGTPAQTDLIIATGDRVGADIVGLGIIKSFGLWGPVTGKGLWEQRQIKRAVEIGVGNRKEDLELLYGGGGADFNRLMEKVRTYAGQG
jgi:uncharacterized protein (DUF362 family)